MTYEKRVNHSPEDAEHGAANDESMGELLLEVRWVWALARDSWFCTHTKNVVLVIIYKW